MHQQLPSNPELEKILLGMLFIYREEIPDVANVLKAEHFYLSYSQIYYKVLLDMVRSSLDFDAQVMAHRMTQFAPGTSTDQTISFVMDCTAAYVLGDPMELSAEIINLWKRRTYIIKCQELATQSYDMSTHIDEIDVVAGDIRTIQGATADDNLQYSEQYITEFVEFMESDHESGMSSRFSNVQKRIGGYEGGNGYWFCGAEKMGKSAALVSEAHHFAKDYPEAVGIYFSLEMNFKLLSRRLTSIDSGIPIEQLKKRDLSQEEWKRAFSSWEWLSKSNLVLETTPQITPEQVEMKCQQVILEKGRLDYIFFDYFQLATSAKKHGTEAEMLKHISRGLHGIAKQFNVPLIGGAQVLTKKLTDRATKRPVLSDVRGSSELQSDAYWMAFLYRESYYEPEIFEGDIEGKQKTELITRAFREGEQGTDYLQFFGECSRFEAAYYETVQL